MVRNSTDNKQDVATGMSILNNAHQMTRFAGGQEYLYF